MIARARRPHPARAAYNAVVAKTSRLVLAYVVCCAIWGTTWYAVRVTMGEGGFAPIVSATYRFSLAALILAGLVWLGRLRPLPASPRVWAWLAVAGVLDAIGYALVYLGEEHIPGGLAAVLFACQPLILAAVMQVIRLEPTRPIDLIAALISLAGVGIIFSDQLDISAQQGLGVAMVLGSALASTLYAVVMKRHAAGIHPIASTAVFIGVTAVSLWLVVLATGGPSWPSPLRTTALAAVLYLAVFGTVIAFATYFWLVQRVSLATTSTTVFVITILAFGVDALFERQDFFAPKTWLGIGVVFLGLDAKFSMLWLTKPQPPRRMENPPTT